MIRRWFARHRNPTNLILHLAGVPTTIIAIPLAVMERWVLAAGLFLAGYALQFLGHIIEGNRSGEELLARRILRRK